MEHKIKIYPVDNADCTLIKLSDKTTIIVDCQFFKNLNDENGKQTHFDVKNDLLNELERDSNNRPFVDLFINTHPHSDHCLGFADVFYIGDEKRYNSKNDENKVIIGEMWVTPIILGNDECADAEDIRKEAKRRRSLYNDNPKFNGKYGDYLHVIGYDKDREFDSRYGYIPGKTVRTFNGNTKNCCSMFIHAPFKEDISKSKSDDDKNAASIVIQFSFFVNGQKDAVAKVLMGGDAEYPIWQHILENNIDNANLEWNLFLAPHHCSWTFFNDTKNKDKVQECSKKILDLAIDKDSYIVASSVEIKDEKPDPPHFDAMNKYLSLIGQKSHFLNTAIRKVEKGIPQPIVFKISDDGILDKTYTIDPKEAKQFSDALVNGTLKVGATGALSTTTGKSVAKSVGFYGEENKKHNS